MHYINLVIYGIELILKGMCEIEPELINFFKNKFPENELKDNIKSREKERSWVIQILNMLKSCNFLKDSPSLILHSYNFKYFHTSHNIKMSGDHDTGLIAPVGDRVVVAFVQVKGCEEDESLSKETLMEFHELSK